MLSARDIDAIWGHEVAGTARRGVAAWLAGPSRLRGGATMVLAILDDVLELLDAYQLRSVWSAEPKTYRLSPRGRAALREALVSGRIEDLLTSTEPAPRPGEASALFHLVLGGRRDPDLALQLSVTVAQVPPRERCDMAVRFAALLQRWFGPLDAVAAFVSGYADLDDRFVGDDPLGTAHERKQNASPLSTWSAVHQFGRGAFWATGLGPDLCARLGGQARVLREAPAPEARPLGEGVWLQLSDVPPPNATALAHLAEYLAPLLRWTQAEVVALHAAARAERTTPPLAAPAEATPTKLAPEWPRPSRRRRRPRIVLLEEDSGLDLGINVYLIAPLTPEQQQAIEEALSAWYADGFGSAFGGAGFHHLSGPSVDVAAAVMRWEVDLGSADPLRALDALAERLGALEAVTVRRVVVGTEAVG